MTEKPFDLRHYARPIVIASIILSNIYYMLLAFYTVSTKDYLGRNLGTISQWISVWIDTVSRDPIGTIFYTGWGPIFYWIPFAMMVTGCLKLAQETPHVKKYGIKFVVMDWHYFLFMCSFLPTLLSVYGTGAKLNLFWDVIAKVPFYPWHRFAHASASYTLTSVINPVDVEGALDCKYRYKFLVILLVVNILSFRLESVENAIVLVYGLDPRRYNDLIDMLNDVFGVAEGCVYSQLTYDGIQYQRKQKP